MEKSKGGIGKSRLTAEAAPALAQAILTPKIALAPNFFFPFVPSSSHIKASISFSCVSTSNFLEIRAGAMDDVTLRTAWLTPLPP
jgi:hypothetical protein